MNDELDPEVGRLVEQARRSRTPSSADRSRVAQRLAASLAAGAAATSTVGSAKAASWAGSSLGLKISAVVVGGALGAAAVVSQLHSSSDPTTARHGAVVPSAPTALPAAPAAAPLEPQVLEPQSELVAPPKLGLEHGHGTPATAMELEQEAALLHQAQAAWRAGQSARALQLASQHAQRFPRSQLANERDVLRVLSLCKLGQTEAAKQVGARLLRSAQGSPWYQSIAESCAK